MTRRDFGKTVGASTIGALTLTQVGCGTSGLIVALDVAEVACTVAVPVVQAFAAQLGPMDALFTSYIGGISNACSLSVTELNNTADSQSVQLANVAKYFAAVVTVNLPAGIATEVSAVIGAIIAAVQIIIKLINKTPAPTPTPVVAAKLKTYHSQVMALGSDEARKADVLAKHQAIRRTLKLD